MGIPFEIKKPKKTPSTIVQGEVKHTKTEYKDNLVIKNVVIPCQIDELIELEGIPELDPESELKSDTDTTETKAKSEAKGKKEYLYRTKESLRQILSNAQQLKLIGKDEKEIPINSSTRIEDGRWEIKVNEKLDNGQFRLKGTLELKLMGLMEEYISASDRIRLNVYIIEYTPLMQDETKAPRKLTGSYDIMAMSFLNEILPPSDDNSIKLT